MLVFFEIDAEPMWQGGLEAAFDDGVESDLLSGVRLGVGAGGGGFLMFMAHDRNKLRHAMAHAGLEEVRFKFDFEGAKVVMSS